MVTNYKLTKSPFDVNRLQKIAKGVMQECKEDRILALSAHQYFKDMVEDNPTDSTAKALMVDCLKVAQNSRNSVIKLLASMVKLESSVQAVGKDGSLASFSELSALSDE